MQLGIDFGDTVGFDNLPGECHVIAVSENGKINVNDPLFLEVGVSPITKFSWCS